MSAVTIPRDSGIAGLAASCRSVELAIAERDVTDRDGTMPKGGVLESSERTPLDQLVQEIHHCKLNHEALREKINSRKVMLDERNQLLNVLQRNLEDIKSENDKLASALGNSRGPSR